MCTVANCLGPHWPWKMVLKKSSDTQIQIRVDSSDVACCPAQESYGDNASLKNLFPSVKKQLKIYIHPWVQLSYIYNMKNVKLRILVLY